MKYRQIALSLVVAFLSCLSALSQSATITLIGRVLDNERSPLAQANVRLLNAQGALSAGAIADASGRFSIPKVKRGQYTLEVSFVGFLPKRQVLNVQAEGQEMRLQDIVLAEDKQLLSEVEVVGKASEVVVKGDTIEYNAGSYTVSQGAAIEELIKKLPGAEISESGEITINGKSVSKIMVDGKRFFDNDPKVALKNLPADVVERIQVLDRDSEAARMTGFSDGDEETVINLTVKRNRKQGLFGTAYAGGSIDLKRYEANASVNRFSEGKQWSLIIGGNNTNNAGFTELASSTVGDTPGRGERGSRRRRTEGDPWTSEGVATSWTGGGNFANTLANNAGEVGAGATLGYGDHLIESKYERTDVLPSGKTTERGQTDSRERKFSSGANLRLEWRPNDKTTLVLSPQLNYGANAGSYSSHATTYADQDTDIINTNTLSQSTESKVLSGKVELDLSRRLSASGRTLTLSLTGNFNSDESNGIYQSELDNRLSKSSTSLDQHLDNGSRSLAYQTRLTYVEPLDKGYALQLLYQLRGEGTRSHRYAYDKDATSGAYTQLNQLYTTEVSSDFLAHRVGLAVKKASDKYDITAGFNLDPSVLDSRTKSGNTLRPIRQEVLNYSPTLRLRYKPSRATDLSIDYRGRSFQPSVNQLAPVQDNTNPLVIMEGNPMLQPGYMHNLFGRLSLFSPKQQTSFNLFGRVQYIQNNIASRALYDPTSGVRTISYVNVDGDYTFVLGGFYSTPLFAKKLSLRIGSFNMLNSQIGFIDGQRNQALSLRLSPNATLAYRTKAIDTSLKGTWAYYKVVNSLSSVSEQATQSIRVDWDTNLTMPLGFGAESQIAYRTNSGYADGYDRDQMLINLGLSYSFGQKKAATLRLKAYDLLSQRSSVYRSATALSSTIKESNALGRYIMLHFIYRLR